MLVRIITSGLIMHANGHPSGTVMIALQMDAIQSRHGRRRRSRSLGHRQQPCTGSALMRMSAGASLLTRSVLFAQEHTMSVSGRNWGDAEIDGSSLVFGHGRRSIFRVALPDVTQVCLHSFLLFVFNIRPLVLCAAGLLASDPREWQLGATEAHYAGLCWHVMKRFNACSGNHRSACRLRLCNASATRKDVSPVVLEWAETSPPPPLTNLLWRTRIAQSLPVSGRSQVQQGRDEVMLEFPVDDTGGDREDALVEMSFYVPRDVEQFPGDEATPSSKARAIWGPLVHVADMRTPSCPRGAEHL